MVGQKEIGQIVRVQVEKVDCPVSSDSIQCRVDIDGNGQIPCWLALDRLYTRTSRCKFHLLTRRLHVHLDFDGKKCLQVDKYQVSFFTLSYRLMSARLLLEIHSEKATATR
jgi:hypothetical protein